MDTLILIAVHFVKPALLFVTVWATITATLIIINKDK